MRREPSQTEVESTTARRRAGIAWLWVVWCLSLALPAFRLEVEEGQIVWIWGWECFSLYVSSGSSGVFCPWGFLHPGWYANLTFALGTAFLANHRPRTAFWISLVGAILAVGTGVIAFVLALSIRLFGPSYLVWAGCMVTLVWFSRREARLLPNPAEYLSLDRVPQAQVDEAAPRELSP